MTLSKNKVSEIVSSFLAKKAEDDAWDAKMVQLADFTFDLLRTSMQSLLTYALCTEQCIGKLLEE